MAAEETRIAALVFIDIGFDLLDWPSRRGNSPPPQETELIIACLMLPASVWFGKIALSNHARLGRPKERIPSPLLYILCGERWSRADPSGFAVSHSKRAVGELQRPVWRLEAIVRWERSGRVETCRAGGNDR